MINVADLKIYVMQNTDIRNISSKFEANSIYHLGLISKKLILVDFFRHLLRQSWKKCVGTLESIFALYCATDARNLNADIYTFLYTEVKPLWQQYPSPSPTKQC